MDTIEAPESVVLRDGTVSRRPPPIDHTPVYQEMHDARLSDAEAVLAVVAHLPHIEAAQALALAVAKHHTEDNEYELQFENYAYGMDFAMRWLKKIVQKRAEGK